MSVPKKFRSIVGGASKVAGAVGVPGAFAFGADVPVLIKIWVTGAILIANKAGHAASKKEITALATTASSGVATFITGSKLATKLFHLVPGPGTVTAIGVNSSLNAIFTYRFLRSVSKVFDQYDNEEMIWQNLKNGLSMISVFTIIEDIEDMMACMSEGKELVDQFKK